ncbi:MAG: hypothetical protein NTW03_01880 [Verrucomicrobia bacterium]|nr:hypothetical protein [Verrucomicrobiota bacterium]
MNPLQYELQFQASRYRRRQSEKLVRPSAARWWFAEMRRVVDQALDWHAASPPKPEQTTLSLSSG